MTTAENWEELELEVAGRELERRERQTRRAENAMWFGLGLFLAFSIVSFTAPQTAWFLTGGFALVAFVGALGFLVSRR